MKSSTLSNRIIGCAIEVHKELGPGLLESTYEACLAHEFDLNETNYCRQHPMPVEYKGLELDCGYRIDLLVEDEVIIELKSVDTLTDLHTAQLLTYLKLAAVRQGFLMNFNAPLLKDGLRSFILDPPCPSPLHVELPHHEEGKGMKERIWKTESDPETGFSYLSNRIIACAIEVHRNLGPGLLKSTYEACLAHEFDAHGIGYRREQPMPVEYKGLKLECGYRVSMLVEDQIVLDPKSVDRLTNIHTAQMRTHMKLAGIRCGLLMNFNERLLKNGLRSLST